MSAWKPECEDEGKTRLRALEVIRTRPDKVDSSWQWYNSETGEKLSDYKDENPDGGIVSASFDFDAEFYMLMGIIVVIVHIIWLIVALMIGCCCKCGGSDIHRWYKMACYVQLPSHLLFLVWGIWMVDVVTEDNNLINEAQETVDDLNMFDDCSYGVLKIDTTEL